MQHKKMIAESVNFFIEKEFRNKYASALDALRKIVALAESAWKIVSKPASGGTDASAKDKKIVHLRTLQDLWTWVVTHLLVVNCKNAAFAWSEQRPRSI